MKPKIYIAFLLLFIGLIYVADWIIFATQKENEKMPWPDFKLKYYNRFPEFMQPLIHNSPLLTVVVMACFTIAGVIFIKEKKKVYFILGIFFLQMAGWQLFSLM